MSQIKGSSGPGPKNKADQKSSIAILDELFMSYGWTKENCVRQNMMIYTTPNDYFSKFVIQHMFDTTYKVSIPLTTGATAYSTTVDSVFDLVEYIEQVLHTREKKNQ